MAGGAGDLGEAVKKPKQSEIRNREWFRLPDDPEARAIVIQIAEAFRGVTRDGGISWEQAMVMDDYGTEELAPSRDRIWQDLVDDPKWEPEDPCSYFAFLDPLGFRYYLPAAMVRAVRNGYSDDLPHQLDPRRNADKLSNLEDAHRDCIRHFLAHMARIESEEVRWTRVLKQWERLPQSQ